MTTFLSRRQFASSGASLLAAQAISHRADAAAQPVLLELFTSQGCSSCPPADRLAEDLSRRPDVIVASLNVDYWDYLGWRDTLARPEYTQRQNEYAQARGDGDVYTPQMVVNGASHSVGSDRKAIEALITQARRTAAAAMVSLAIEDSDVRIDVSGQGSGTVWLMSLASAVTVDIARGENAGNRITYHNVVRNLTPAGLWKSGQTSFSLPRKAVIGPGCSRCIAIAQDGMVGRVLGLGLAQVPA